MDPIVIEGRSGGPMLRDGIVVAFFRQTPFDGWAPDVDAVLTRWLQLVPEHALTHALVGAEATVPAAVDDRTLPRCRAQLDAATAASRSISSLELGGPGPVNPAWRFSVWGGMDAPRHLQARRTNYVQMRMPTAWVDDTGNNLASFVRGCANALRFDSGYASPALCWSTESELAHARPKIAGLALRHPGLDIPDHDELRFALGRRCVGARWLTLLGPELADHLGGAAALRARLAGAVTVTTLDKGLELRAAGPPRRGDVNAGDRLDALRTMARVLEPVTHTETESRLWARPEAHERWQRRFLDE